MTIFKTVSVLALVLAFVLPTTVSAAVGGSAARQACVQNALTARTNAINVAKAAYTSSLPVAKQTFYTAPLQVNRANWQTAHNVAKAIAAPAARANALELAEAKFRNDNAKTTASYKIENAKITATLKNKFALANAGYTNATKVCPK